MKNLELKREIKSSILLFAACLCGSFGMHMIVYPSSFAPAGVDGIATMLQELTKVNAGIYTIILNIPLLILAWLLLKKRYVIYTIVFTLITSGLLIVLGEVEFWQYVTETDRLIAALFSGILLGVRTGLMIKIGASTGGADIIACVVQSKRPYGNIERIISLICYVIMGFSYFVYKDMNCILLSIVQLIVFEKVMGLVLSSTRHATEVKIVTKHAEELKHDILFTLKHGGTLTESTGLYTGEVRTVISSVINNRQLPEFLQLIKKYPDTFVYYSDVKGVNGNFRWQKDDIAK
ncbi:MAG: YitT family protein [Clostridia bacterium]|nr:YitT family protein [Clostridia bacterium]